MRGTNFAHFLLRFKSTQRIFATTGWDKPDLEEISLMLKLPSPETIPEIVSMFSCVWADRGRPDRAASVTCSLPSLNLFAQTLTCVLLRVLSPQTSRSLLQHSMGVTPLLTKNLIVTLCSHLSLMAGFTKNKSNHRKIQLDRNHILTVAKEIATDPQSQNFNEVTRIA